MDHTILELIRLGGYVLLAGLSIAAAVRLAVLMEANGVSRRTRRFLLAGAISHVAFGLYISSVIAFVVLGTREAQDWITPFVVLLAVAQSYWGWVMVR